MGNMNNRVKFLAPYIASALGVLLFISIYLPISHATTLAEMEKKLQEKNIEVEQVIEETKEITTELTTKVERVSEEKEQVETEKAQIEEEKAKIEEEKTKTEATSKEKEQTLEQEKKKLEKEIEELKKENEVLEKKVSIKEKQKQEEQRVMVASTKAKSQPLSKQDSGFKSNTQSRSIQKTTQNTSDGKTLNVTATAYTAKCKGCSGITATGLDIRYHTPKIIAVDPSVIPLGTRVEIIHNGVSMGQYTAQDTGGAIKGNKIDILFSTKSEAYKWGRQSVQVKILGK